MRRSQISQSKIPKVFLKFMFSYSAVITEEEADRLLRFENDYFKK